MLYSDKEDINNWKNCGIVSSYVLRRQYDNPYDAAKNGNLECFKFLIKNGYHFTDFFLDCFMMSMVSICIDNDYLEIIEYISDDIIPIINGNIFNIDTMLYIGISCGNMKYIDLLIEKGANVHNIYCPMKTCVTFENLKMLKYLGTLGATQNINIALEESVINHNNIDITKCLIELGADLHYNNESALLWAINMKKNDITKYLVECGADIHVLDDAALYISARTLNIYLTKYLIDCGADIKTLTNKNPITLYSIPTQDVLEYYTELGARFEFFT
jgi:ankyrin repeat protein